MKSRILWFIGLYFASLIVVGGAMFACHFIVVLLGGG